LLLPTRNDVQFFLPLPEPDRGPLWSILQFAKPPLSFNHSFGFLEALARHSREKENFGAIRKVRPPPPPPLDDGHRSFFSRRKGPGGNSRRAPISPRLLSFHQPPGKSKFFHLPVLSLFPRTVPCTALSFPITSMYSPFFKHSPSALRYKIFHRCDSQRWKHLVKNDPLSASPSPSTSSTQRVSPLVASPSALSFSPSGGLFFLFWHSPRFLPSLCLGKACPLPSSLSRELLDTPKAFFFVPYNTSTRDFHSPPTFSHMSM